jgi:hypothetical protein
MRVQRAYRRQPTTVAADHAAVDGVRQRLDAVLAA